MWNTSTACTPTTPGSFGPDQITKTNYDAANRVTSIVKGYGSGSPITDSAIAYGSGTNLVASVADGNGNSTGYVYDGQARKIRTDFPNSSYELYYYDGNGNVTGQRLRSGDLVYRSYDALNRLANIDMPGGTASDTYFGYDLLGDRLYARYASPGGAGTDFTYDALQRKTSETSNSRTVGSQYDAAGNRTRLTYPDGNYIQYSYDILNRMRTVKQNGSTTLATYSYDDLGRETGLNRGNGVNTAASYSNTSKSWSLATTGASQNVTFGLDYTPAGQVNQRTISNNAYAYSAPAASVNYSPNNLNQYSTVGVLPTATTAMATCRPMDRAASPMTSITG